MGLPQLKSDFPELIPIWSLKEKWIYGIRSGLNWAGICHILQMETVFHSPHLSFNQNVICIVSLELLIVFAAWYHKRDHCIIIFSMKLSRIIQFFWMTRESSKIFVDRLYLSFVKLLNTSKDTANSNGCVISIS